MSDPMLAAAPTSGPHPGLAALAILILTVFAFLGVRHNGFVDFDDPDYVTNNDVVQSGLTAEGLVWAFEDAHFANWHPLTWLSHMVDCQLFGLDAGWHHLSNVLVHAAAAILAFLALRALGIGGWPSLVAAMLFAVHPLRVESVAWVSERKDTLSGLFFMATLLAYARYVKQPGLGRYALVALMLVCGLLSKSMLVTLPCVLLLLDVWPLARFDRKAILEKLPLFGLTLAVAVVTFLSQRGAGAMGAPLSLADRVANAPVAYVTYLRKTIWPTDLAIYYPHPALLAKSQGLAGAIAGALLAAVTVGLLRARRRLPFLWVGWLWFLGVLVPVIGLIQVGTQPFADRYTYLATFGPVLAVVCLAWRWAEQHESRRRVFLGACTLAVLACVFLTRAQVYRWHDTERLFTHAARVTTDNYVALGHMGVGAENRGDLKSAQEHYEAALAVNPGHGVSLNNLGIVHARQNRLEQAGELFLRAVQADPRHADAHANLGRYHLNKGDEEAALGSLRRAVAIEPGHVNASTNLGLILRRRGLYVEAAPHLAAALRGAPNNAELLEALGVCEAAFGRSREAVELLRRALARDPSSASVLSELAWVLATAAAPGVRDGAEALRRAQDAVQRTGRTNPLALRALAAASAETGDFAEAVRNQERALQLTAEAGRQALVVQLERYRAGQPWRVAQLPR